MADERKDSDLSGDYARDTHPDPGFGDDYAREKPVQTVESEKKPKPKDEIKIGKASE